MVRSLAWFRQKANRDEVSHLDLTVETPTPAEGAVGCHDILIKVITLNCDIQMTATSFESKHLFSDASSKLPIFLIATNNNLLKPFVLLFFSLPPQKNQPISWPRVCPNIWENFGGPEGPTLHVAALMFHQESMRTWCHFPVWSLHQRVQIPRLTREMEAGEIWCGLYLYTEKTRKKTLKFCRKHGPSPFLIGKKSFCKTICVFFCCIVFWECVGWSVLWCLSSCGVSLRRNTS